LATWELPLTVKKVDTDQRLVFGFLSVSKDEHGHLIVDSQDDYIEPEELEKAVYNYNLFARNAGDMHHRVGVGRLVESMCFTKEKAAALGIAPGILPECAWWVGYKVDDDETWSRIKSGEYSAFSIGGTGRRIEDHAR
jgi:Putative phage serine protease XkdF